MHVHPSELRSLRNLCPYAGTDSGEPILFMRGGQTGTRRFGIAVDPDVDRLVLIDEKGEPYGEEYTIATCADFILSKKADTASKPSVVVIYRRRVQLKISRISTMRRIRTPVGEINVAKRMKRSGLSSAAKEAAE